jgi:hypothetical protein
MYALTPEFKAEKTVAASNGPAPPERAPPVGAVGCASVAAPATGWGAAGAAGAAGVEGDDMR